MRPVATANRKSANTIAAQVSMTGRLFQTSAMLDPMAVSESIRRSSNIGIANVLIANEKAMIQRLNLRI